MQRSNHKSKTWEALLIDRKKLNRNVEITNIIENCFWAEKIHTNLEDNLEDASRSHTRPVTVDNLPGLLAYLFSSQDPHNHFTEPRNGIIYW